MMHYPLNLCALTVLAASCLESVSSQRLRPSVRGDAHHMQEHIPQVAPPNVDPPADTNNPCQSVIAVEYLHIPEDQDDGVFDRTLSNVDDGEEFLCELADGTTLPISGTSDQISEMRAMLQNGSLISAHSTVAVAADSADLLADAAAIAGMPAQEGELGRLMEPTITLAPGNVIVQASPDSGRRLRRLATYEGKKKILVVRVIDKDGRAVPESAEEVSDKIFGTYGDTATMTSQFAACSFNALEIVWDDFDRRVHAARGVIEVKINVSLDNGRSTIRNAVTTEVNKVVNTNAYDHVMYVLEACYQECGWAAYAYVNSWNSVYQNRYFKYVGVQMHEIGHNLNFAHSGGLDGKTYTDHTCLLGNPLYSDDVGKMCFNPAKNYQMAISSGGKGWYDPQFIHTWTRSNSLNHWHGILVGVAEYDQVSPGQYVVLKLETGGDEDYYLGFNRATGPNAENDEADDEVTVVTTGNNGLSYGLSSLKATLKENETHKVTKWPGGKDLTIQVLEINLEAKPSYAEVIVCYDTCPSLETSDPTSRPSLRPTSPPTSIPTPVPTSSPTNIPTTNPTSRPTSAPTSSPTNIPTTNPTSRPTSVPTSSPTNVPTNLPTPPPVSLEGLPTKSPTQEPTKAPTDAPTHAPTNVPTTANPTSNPTSEPTNAPTEPPTPGPTNAPTTANPTSNPTPEPTNAPTEAPTPGPTAAPTSKPTNVPTVRGGCGDSVCGNDETPESCPNDCIVLDYPVGSKTDKNTKAFMFNVRATTDITIMSLDFFPKKNGDASVEIYTKLGSYEGSEENEKDWDIIVDQQISLRRNDIAPMEDLVEGGVFIPAGEVRAFLISSNRGLLFGKGQEENILYQSDGKLQVFSGISQKRAFQTKKEVGEWTGKISYVASRAAVLGNR